jgi:TonB family protein
MAKQQTAKFLALLTVAMTTTGLSMIPAHASMDGPPRIDSSYPNRQPPYPDTAQDNGEEGTILVDVYVLSSGKPLRAKISQSSGFQDLDIAAEQGALNWHFLPAMRDGDTVSGWTTVKIVFQLPHYVPAPGSPPTANPPAH